MSYLVTSCHLQTNYIYINTMWGPPVISRFRFAPVTIVISTINHSYGSHLHQLSYRTGASHCIYELHLKHILWGSLIGETDFDGISVHHSEIFEPWLWVSAAALAHWGPANVGRCRNERLQAMTSRVVRCLGWPMDEPFDTNFGMFQNCSVSVQCPIIVQ